MRSEQAGRRLTHASSAVALGLNLAILLLIQLLPESSSQVSRHVFLYAAFSACMSLAGLVGAHKRNSTWINVFANYLLLDAAVFTIPRLLLTTYAATVPYNLCPGPAPHPSAVSPSQIAFRSSPAYAAAAVDSALHPPRRIERVEQWASGIADLGRGRCLAASWGLVAVLAIGVGALTVAQWVACFRVRRYARLVVREAEKEDHWEKDGRGVGGYRDDDDDDASLARSVV